MKKVFFILFLAIVFFGFQEKAEAALPSQCTGSQESGTQTGCNHESDAAIRQQCNDTYPATFCGSVEDYLSALADECDELKPSGVDCNTITKNGFYGREAKKFADFIESNPDKRNTSPLNRGNSSDQPSGMSGDLNFPTGFNLPDPEGGIREVIASFLDWLLLIVGIIAMIAFIISGLQYFLASADEKMAEMAKRNMTYAIYGIIAALSGFIIVRAVDAALRASSFF